MDGDDHLADLEFLGERHRVHRPGAAIGEEREVARVDAAADGDGADRVGHAGVDDVEDALRHRLGRKAERCGDLRRPPWSARRQVERHPAAGEVRGVDAAEHGVGVGDRRLGAAAAVAGRAGDRAGALRPDADMAALEPGERAAAGADDVDVDDRHLDRQALELGLGRRASAGRRRRGSRRRRCRPCRCRSGSAAPATPTPPRRRYCRRPDRRGASGSGARAPRPRSSRRRSTA